MHTYDARHAEAEQRHARPARPGPVPNANGLLDLQRSVGNAGVTALVQRGDEEERSPVLGVLSSGGGRALDAPVRAEMEARLGHRFDDVRVHTDAAADASARAVDAAAYTVGSDVVFGSGRYDPSSAAGRTLLAHELTHVVQQRSGPVDGTPVGGGIQVSDPGDRFEREASTTADRAMAAPMPADAPAAAPTVAPVQREVAVDEDEEEADGGTSVQRIHSGAEGSLGER